MFLVAMCFAGFLQAQNLMLVEEFTQASCPPCEATTPMLNEILEANVEKVVQLRYQTSWPGVDPMNADNPQDVQARVDYYGVTGVPSLLANGAVPSGPQFPELITQANIDAGYATDTPISVEVSHTLSDDFTTTSMTVTITNNSAEMYDMPNDKLRVAGVEEKIVWPFRPGSTSITTFDAVMKKFYGGVAGVDVPAIAAGESYTVEMTDEAMPARIYSLFEYGVVAFVQNDDSRRTMAAGHSAPLEIEGLADLGISTNSSVDGGLCDYEFKGSATVENPSSGDATGYTVSMSINGTEVQTIEEEGTIAAGATADVQFDEITLSPGTSVISYTVTPTGVDGAILNNFTPAITAGKAGAEVDNLKKDFEGQVAGEVPTGAIREGAYTNFNFAIVDASAFGTTGNFGGYGESVSAMLVNFYGWNPASIDGNASLTIGERYITPDAGAILTFDRAYTSYQGSQDALAIEVSTDCGETFTQVWRKAGSDLATAPEVNGAAFIPTADQWVTEEIDLTDYAGETVLIRFAAESQWGDMLYIDNVTMSEITDIVEIEDAGTVEIFPNPAVTSATINLDINNSSTVTLEVTDIMGQQISRQNLGTIAGKTSMQYDVTALPAGTYIFKVIAGQKSIAQKISVVK